MEFVLIVGETREANPNSTSERDEFITVGGERVFVKINELFHRDISSREELRELVEDFIQNAVESSTSFRGDQISLKLVGDRFRLISRPGSDGSDAPLLTTTYSVIDQTRLQLIGGFDITDPDFSEATRIQNPRDQRFFERTLAPQQAYSET